MFFAKILYRGRPPDASGASRAFQAVSGWADGGGFAGLADPAGFAGAGGLFRFGADRVAERGLAIYRAARDRFEVVDPAPRSFAVPAF